MKKILSFLFFSLIVCAFFQPFFIKKLLPIPSDTIVGLYYPFRDYYAKSFAQGIPFKNFLITDPVRQEYPWRFLSMQFVKQGSLPLWNPYEGVGTPLLANQQSAVLYPFNLLFFVLPFSLAWSSLVFFTPLLGGIFVYIYAKHLKCSSLGSLLGGVTFAFCGFSIAWLEWNTVLQTFIWLPLILLAVDKLFSSKKKLVWGVVFVFALASSFLAGHLQTFFYVFLVQLAYMILKITTKFSWKVILFYILCSMLFAVVILPQLIPLLQLIHFSGRNVDLVSWTTPGWFIPYQHFVQFVSPDFFGNPTTLNYFGVWNYAELVGYVGILPLLMSCFALIAIKRKIVWFFAGVLLFALLFAIENPISVLPFTLHIPLLSTSQPTRLLSLIDFSLAILASFGFTYLETKRSKTIGIVAGGGVVIFTALWVFLLIFGKHILPLDQLAIAKRNTIFPTSIFICVTAGILFLFFNLSQKLKVGILVLLLLLTSFDLIRFGNKFTTFTNQAYLFPTTKTLQFLQTNIGDERIMTTDSRIFPPNFSTMYHIASVDIYDPLYLLRYAEFIAAMERGQPNILPPFGFNKIITPHNYQSSFINLLGVKYILSLTDLKDPAFKKVFQEGQTKVYENTKAFPKAFFVKNIISSNNKQQTINLLFQKKDFLATTAIIEDFPSQKKDYSVGIIDYVKNNATSMIIHTNNLKTGFLVITNSYYPTWHATIDQVATTIFLTDYIFEGIIIPPGKHTIQLSDSLF